MTGPPEADAGATDVDDADVDEAAPPAGGPASAGGPWAAIGGFVSFAYVVWYVIDLALVRTNPIAFNAAHRVYGNLAARVVFAAVFGAIVFHGLDGVRRTVVDHVAVVGRHDLVARTVVRFVTFAVWIPAVLVLIWPAIRDWFSR